MIQLILKEIQNQVTKRFRNKAPLWYVVLLQLYSKILQKIVQKFWKSCKSRLLSFWGHTKEVYSSSCSIYCIPCFSELKPF